MKVLLRRLGTGEYLGQDGRWTENAELARDFVQVSAAVEFALDARLSGVRVVVWHSGGGIERERHGLREAA